MVVTIVTKASSFPLLPGVKVAVAAAPGAAAMEGLGASKPYPRAWADLAAVCPGRSCLPPIPVSLLPAR